MITKETYLQRLQEIRKDLEGDEEYNGYGFPEDYDELSYEYSRVIFPLDLDVLIFPCYNGIGFQIDFRENFIVIQLFPKENKVKVHLINSYDESLFMSFPLNSRIYWDLFKNILTSL